MKVKELSPAIIATLKNKRYDRIVEKHEGPETWDWQLPPSEERVQEMKKRYGNMGYDFSEFILRLKERIETNVVVNQIETMLILFNAKG